MSYSIYCDGVPLYVYGGTPEYTVIAPTLSRELNTAGELTFSIAPTNAMYNDVRTLSSIIEVFKDNKPHWRGRVISVRRGFNNLKAVTCEGDLAFFNDYLMRPFEYRGTIEGYIDLLLSNYNAAIDETKRFKRGNVTVIDSNDYVYFHKETLSSVFDCLKSHLIDTHGGYIITRRGDDGYYLDYLSEPGKASNQTIMFGRNLISFDEYIDASDVYTVIIPKGADVETGETDENGTEITEKLDIKSVNNGRDYIESDDGIALFGRIEREVEFENYTVAQNLYNRALDELNGAIQAAVTIEISAVDLHYLNVNTDSLELGDFVRCVSNPHSIDGRFMMSANTAHLDAPGEETYTFGATPTTLTGIIGTINRIGTAYNNEPIAVNIEDKQTYNRNRATVGVAVCGYAITWGVA